jgi:hypothetical protein
VARVKQRRQIVNFHLAGIGDEEFRAMSDQLACLREVPGLISKTFNAVKTHPNFVEVSSREFGVLDGPSRITRAFGPALATA